MGNSEKVIDPIQNLDISNRINNTNQRSEISIVNTCNISVVIPTYNRPDQLLEAIAKILACNPYPDEIIVHIDGGDNVTEQAIRDSQFQDVLILKSSSQVGPGGGRNRAIARAKHEIVASFDDDSYPIDTDYFSRLCNDGGINDVIQNEVHGLTVPPKDIEAAAIALERMLANPEQRLQMGQEAKNLIERSLTWDAKAQELIDRFEQALAPSSPQKLIQPKT